MTTTHIIQRTVSANRGRRLIVAGPGSELSDVQRERLSQYFEHIDCYLNPNDITPEAWSEADAIFGLGYRIQSFDQVPRLRFVQLSSAGADTLLQSPIWKEDERASQVQMATAAGVHVAAIPQVSSMLESNYAILNICYAVVHHVDSRSLAQSPVPDTHILQ
jgi:hypothetical protein